LNHKYLIIVFIITVILYVIYLLKDRLIWFAKIMKITMKNINSKKKIQKLGMDARTLSNEQIEKYIQLSCNYLKKLNIDVNRRFKLNQELERYLKYSRFSEKHVLQLLNEITEYMRLDDKRIELKVNYVSSRKNLEYAGLYMGTKEQNVIVLNIKNDMTIDTVISVLAHECTHYLLLSNGIKLEDTKENEWLTDMTTIILGFEKYMIEAHKASNDIIYDTVSRRIVKKNCVGYLTNNDIKYAIKKKKVYITKKVW